jgi:hypothetical protein
MEEGRRYENAQEMIFAKERNLDDRFFEIPT